MNGCTIVARNYLPFARVLADSFQEHHPEGRFVTLVLDPLDSSDGERFEVWSPYDLGIDRREVHRMAMIYDVKELATAVKPFLLKRLLEEGLTDVAYFDPDIWIFTPLEDIAELAREHSIVIGPHLSAPLPNDGLRPTELRILRAGVFNLGFIAVGSRATPFLDWWSEHLRRDCLVAVDKGLFVDQRWIDLVPAFFEHHILRDPAVNVAYWNVAGRDIESRDARYEIDGMPLRFFHFSGFDPREPHLLSAHVPEEPRARLSQAPGLARLCRAYAEKLFDKGFGQKGARGYAFDALPGGEPIDRELRRLYRSALIAAERGEGHEPPEPFDPSSADRFSAWIQARRGGVGSSPVEARLRRMAEDHPSLGRAKPAWRGVRAAVRWGKRVSRPAPTRFPVEVPRRPGPGVNLVGYLTAELGVGEIARRLAHAMDEARIPHATVAYDRTKNRQSHPFSPTGHAAAPFDVNVVCINADRLPMFREDVGPALFRGRYTIGVWFWEVSDFPDRFDRSFDLVDEVWVASDFVREAIAAKTRKPVRVVPLPVVDPASVSVVGNPLVESSGFRFLFTFDFRSVFERKNPLAVLAAFDRAFAVGEGPNLMIKTINGETNLASLEKLLVAAAHRPDVHVHEGYITADEMSALSSSCDSYVSLHRSEGYGLTIVDAMARAKPVIATGYSGNLAYMTEQNSYLVPYRLLPIGEGNRPYPAGAVWADPDVGDAARLMRYVYEHPDEASERGRRGRDDLLDSSLERTAAFIAGRCADIRARGRRHRVAGRGKAGRSARRPTSTAI
jgi:glycosyltransferase involved in cell wall biosynthesis